MLLYRHHLNIHFFHLIGLIFIWIEPILTIAIIWSACFVFIVRSVTVLFITMINFSFLKDLLRKWLYCFLLLLKCFLVNFAESLLSRQRIQRYGHVDLCTIGKAVFDHFMIRIYCRSVFFVTIADREVFARLYRVISTCSNVVIMRLAQIFQYLRLSTHFIGMVKFFGVNCNFCLIIFIVEVSSLPSCWVW